MRYRPLVHFLGWGHGLERPYADADALALTSHNEATLVAVTEAFAAGVPVLAARGGGMEDIVRPGMGLLVPRASALAATIEATCGAATRC